MDWYTLLLIFIFFIIPLIQKIAESRGKGGAPPTLPEESEEGEAFPIPRRTTRVPEPRRIPQTGEESWSSEWGSWPEEGLGGAPVGTAPERLDVPAPISTRPPSPLEKEPRRREMPTAGSSRLPAPVGREQQRRDVPPPLANRPTPPVEVVRGRRTPPPAPAPISVQPAIPAASEAANVRLPRRARAKKPAPPIAVARILRGGEARHDLKRAIILSEILSPPRAVRPLEQHPGE